LPLLAHLRATQPLTDYHVSYAAFANLASKSDLLTLRDVYLKMLMCTKGVTGDRALEMQKRWPTPVQLVDALRRCGADAAEQSTATRQADMVAAELKDLVGRKKMGKALAQKVADVWGVPC
jgi:crossover junction endonuclease MUS81